MFQILDILETLFRISLQFYNQNLLFQLTSNIQYFFRVNGLAFKYAE